MTATLSYRDWTITVEHLGGGLTAFVRYPGSSHSDAVSAKLGVDLTKVVSKAKRRIDKLIGQGAPGAASMQA